MEPERRPNLRVGDAEREDTLERLRAAHAEGRLDADEFYGRLDEAYRSRTYADLDALVVDLPPAGLTRFPPPAGRHPVAPATGSTAYPRAARAAAAGGGFLASLPAPLRAAWIAWATAVTINVIIWVAVSAGNGVAYFWPIWVAGPWGAILAGSTVMWRMNRGDPGPPGIGRGS